MSVRLLNEYQGKIVETN